jgi:hypothetical protein
MDADPHRLHPDHLPTPFTAAQIRDTCRPGRTLRVRLERAGADPVLRIVRYVAADADEGEQEAWVEGPDGLPAGAAERSRATWLELQEHASFPEATTTRDEERISIPAGTFDCLRYVREDGDGTWRFWFARDLPGQPVRFEQEVRGQVVFRMTLLENVPAPG